MTRYFKAQKAGLLCAATHSAMGRFYTDQGLFRVQADRQCAGQWKKMGGSIRCTCLTDLFTHHDRKKNHMTLNTQTPVTTAVKPEHHHTKVAEEHMTKAKATHFP